MYEANHLTLARAWESIEYLAEIGRGIVDTAAIMPIHEEGPGFRLAYVNAEWIELLDGALKDLEGSDVQEWQRAMGLEEQTETDGADPVAADLATILRNIIQAYHLDNDTRDAALAALAAYDGATKEVAR